MQQSRIYNLRETKVIRDLNPADINKLISVSGMVRGAGMEQMGGTGWVALVYSLSPRPWLARCLVIAGAVAAEHSCLPS